MNDNTAQEMNAPLSGVTVIDLGQIYSGPYCGFLLAMAGARVIKVENLDGEHMRKRTAVGGAALPFAMLNSNKECVTLNLKSARGRELLLEMVERADVLLENFAPGVMKRLGLAYETLSDRNPRIVYGSGSGYGLSGPNRDLPAMDLTVQAMAGIMTITGFPDRPPVKAGPAICDFSAGVHLYGAIMTALFRRERTGKGSLVEVSMQEAVYPTLSSSLGLHHASATDMTPRTGNRHPGLAESPYNVYPTKDGWIAIICVGEKQWQAMLQAMEREDLAGEARFASLKQRVEHLDEIDEIVSGFTSRWPKHELVARLNAFRVPCAPVRELEEVINDPHMHARGALAWVDHPMYGRLCLPNSPLRFADVKPRHIEPSGALGRDNAAVYGEWLGLGIKDRDALEAEGVI